MRQIAVIGLGRFGSTVARELTEHGAEVLAIDQNRDMVEAIKDHVTYAVALNSTDEGALRAVNVQDVDVAVVCVGENLEANLLTTLLLKKMGVKKVWSRAISPLQREILKALDVDFVINLEEEMGRSIARSLVSDHIHKRMPISPGLSIAEVRVPAAMVGKTVRQANVKRIHKLEVVSLRKQTPEITASGERTFSEHHVHFPAPEVKLDENDVMTVVGLDKDIEKFSA